MSLIHCVENVALLSLILSMQESIGLEQKSVSLTAVYFVVLSHFLSTLHERLCVEQVQPFRLIKVV